MTELHWHRWYDGFWRSRCGRFDVFGHSMGWTAVDWDTGTAFRTPDRGGKGMEKALQWCETRLDK